MSAKSAVIQFSTLSNPARQFCVLFQYTVLLIGSSMFLQVNKEVY
jgi:hypothetical protein